MAGQQPIMYTIEICHRKELRFYRFFRSFYGRPNIRVCRLLDRRISNSRSTTVGQISSFIDENFDYLAHYHLTCHRIPNGTSSPRAPIFGQNNTLSKHCCVLVACNSFPSNASPQFLAVTVWSHTECLCLALDQNFT